MRQSINKTQYFRLRLYWLLFWYSLIALWVFSECSLSALWVLTDCWLIPDWLLEDLSQNDEDWLLFRSLCRTDGRTDRRTDGHCDSLGSLTEPKTEHIFRLLEKETKKFGIGRIPQCILLLSCNTLNGIELCARITWARWRCASDTHNNVFC